jgi:hypothetical protein
MSLLLDELFRKIEDIVSETGDFHSGCYEYYLIVFWDVTPYNLVSRRNVLHPSGWKKWRQHFLLRH